MKKRTIRNLLLAKYNGEPEFPATEIDDHTRGDILNWYSNNYGGNSKKIKEFWIEYFETIIDQSSIEKLKLVPDSWINSTGAWIARLIVRGADLPEKTIDLFNEIQNKMLSKAIIPVDKKSKSEIILSKVFCDLEEFRDNESLDDIDFIINYFNKQNLVKGILQSIHDKYTEKRENDFNDFEYLVKNNELKNDVKDEYETQIEFTQNVIDACEALIENAPVKRRKPRKKKPVTPEKALKHFTYKKEGSEVPKKILSSSEVWLYNEPYKLLTCLKALEGKCLGVHRTAITNIDESKSISKRIGRKTDIVLTRVRNESKVVLRRIMQEIKTEPSKLQIRVTNNTQILRIEK